MLCAICQRGPRGFGYCLPRTYRVGWEIKITKPEQRQASYQRFCSQHCQDVYCFWIQKDEGLPKDKKIMPLNNFEDIAAEATLPDLGICVAEIGIDKSLSQYSKDEILQVVNTIIKTYNKKLQELYSEDIPF